MSRAARCPHRRSGPGASTSCGGRAPGRSRRRRRPAVCSRARKSLRWSWESHRLRHERGSGRCRPRDASFPYDTADAIWERAAASTTPPAPFYRRELQRLPSSVGRAYTEADVRHVAIGRQSTAAENVCLLVYRAGSSNIDLRSDLDRVTYGHDAASPTRADR